MTRPNPTPSVAIGEWSLIILSAAYLGYHLIAWALRGFNVVGG